ncbi:hypothetical protein NC652_022248 [Populus alba x Populus x berolinensis]|nr:hypothetical protein NC652_022248 [Populus alba x Populus x berolinensis]
MNLANCKGSMSTSTSGGVWKASDGVSDQFPAGYKVPQSSRDSVGCLYFEENKNEVMIITWMDLKLLELIGTGEMDLPLDDGKNVVMKGVTHGACDYLIKTNSQLRQL